MATLGNHLQSHRICWLCECYHALFDWKDFPPDTTFSSNQDPCRLKEALSVFITINERQGCVSLFKFDMWSVMLNKQACDFWIKWVHPMKTRAVDWYQDHAGDRTCIADASSPTHAAAIASLLSGRAKQHAPRLISFHEQRNWIWDSTCSLQGSCRMSFTAVKYFAIRQ